MLPDAPRRAGNREQGTGNRGILGAGALRGEALRLVPAAAGTAQGDPSRASGRTEGKSSVMAPLGPTRASLHGGPTAGQAGLGVLRRRESVRRQGDALRALRRVPDESVAVSARGRQAGRTGERCDGSARSYESVPPRRAYGKASGRRATLRERG